MILKYIRFSLVLVVLPISVAAQPKPCTHHLERPFENEQGRIEIIIPQVNGLNVYKADLHIHTIYSDGEVTPDMRVVEAWQDGLDVIAITDHMEYRRIEREMFKYMDRYIREDLRKHGQAVNINLSRKGPDEYGLLVDFNVAYNCAKKKSAVYGNEILVVRGVEITRKGYGDYNALFTTDNNLIYDPEIEKAIANARAQGAFIVHNHPDYDPSSPDHITELARGLYNKGLVDGVEIANGRRTWWHLFDYALDGGYTQMANSDIHEYIYHIYGRPSDYDIPRYRNMNLILANSKTENDLCEALKAGNTIAYTNNNLIGKTDLLKSLFLSCVKFQPQDVVGAQRHIKAVNLSSLPYYFRVGDKEYMLNALSSLHLVLPKEAEIADVEILNMWCGNDQHPSVSIELSEM